MGGQQSQRKSKAFHEGERIVQEQAGVRAQAERVGGIIHSEMPKAAQEFLAQQPMVIAGFADASGRTWASILTGPPGFARAESDTVLALDAEPAESDPLRTVWASGTHIGLLAIELLSRRRMRVNGELKQNVGGSMTLVVQSAYANCPKYIQARELEPAQVSSESPARRVRAQRFSALDAAQRACITRSDTFFIATAHPEVGADASHRGGTPGFVQVAADGTSLAFPDYAGNNMFNTLGNLAVNSSAGLLFVDFATGDTLQITGTATVDWSKARSQQSAGAERVIDFRIEEALYTQDAIPLRWNFVSASPFNP